MKRTTPDGNVKKFGVLAKLGALLAAIAKPFRRKSKPSRTLLQTLQPKNKEPERKVSLRGIGKAARALRKQRRRHIKGSFLRLLQAKPMGAGRVDARGAVWRQLFESFRASWERAERGGGTVRLGRRAQKRSRRLARLLEVRVMKRAKRELRDVDVLRMTAALRQAGGAR